MTKDDKQKLLYLNLKGYTIHKPSIVQVAKFLWAYNDDVCRRRDVGKGYGLLILNISDMYEHVTQ